DRDQQRPIFLALEREGDRARQDIDQQKAEKEEYGSLNVGGGPDLRKVRNLLAKCPQNQRTEEHQIDDRRDQRQRELKNKDVRQSDPAESAVLRAEQCVAVLPERLQRAESPPEALADKRARGFGSFGPGDSFFVVADAPAEAADGDGEIGIFSNRVGGDSTGGFDCLLAPRAERTGNDGDAVEKIESALFHVLASDVLERLP